MEKLVKRVRSSKGYVSIETIVIAGVIICLGVFLILKLQSSAENAGDTAANKIDDAISSADASNPNESE